MVIEKTVDELVIRFPIATSKEYLQEIIDYLRYMELPSNYSIVQSERDVFAGEITELPRTAEEINLSVMRGMEQYRQGKGISHSEFLKEQEIWK
jgi:hypothetical protein